MPRSIFYYTALERVIRAINTANGLSLSDTNCIISKPAPVSGSWNEMNTDKNTVVKVSQRVPAVTYNGKNWCVYNRTTLTAFLNQLPNANSLKVDKPKTTHDLIRAINRRWGMGLETTDIVNSPITTLDENGTGQVAIFAHPESLMWIGSHTFNVAQSDAMLNENVTTTTMPGFTYPDGTYDPVANYGYAQPYSYQYNFTLRSDQLHAIKANDAVDPLVEILTYITGSAWTNAEADAAASQTLTGSVITYNGLNTASMPTNSAFKYVLVLKMGAKSKFKGTMYLHYNDKDDSNVPT